MARVSKTVPTPPAKKSDGDASATTSDRIVLVVEATAAAASAWPASVVDFVEPLLKAAGIRGKCVDVGVGLGGDDDDPFLSLAVPQQDRRRQFHRQLVVVVPRTRVRSCVLPGARAVCSRGRDEKVNSVLLLPFLDRWRLRSLLRTSALPLATSPQRPSSPLPTTENNSTWTSDASRFRSWLSRVRFAGSGSSQRRRRAPACPRARRRGAPLPLAPRVWRPPGGLPQARAALPGLGAAQGAGPWPHSADCGRREGRVSADEALLGVAARGASLSLVLPPPPAAAAEKEGDGEEAAPLPRETLSSRLT